MNERTPAEQQRLDEILDSMNAGQLMSEMSCLFGVGRVAELIGWAVIWGLTGVQSVRELRSKLEDRGMSQASAYRAATDFKRFGDHLYAKYHRRYDLPELLEKMAYASNR